VSGVGRRDWSLNLASYIQVTVLSTISFETGILQAISFNKVKLLTKILLNIVGVPLVYLLPKQVYETGQISLQKETQKSRSTQHAQYAYFN
jgi:hypothetical protein